MTKEQLQEANRAIGILATFAEMEGNETVKDAAKTAQELITALIDENHQGT